MRILCLTLLLAACAQAQDPLLWGGLEPGPHAVGFQSFIDLDPSRDYGGKARPILFEIWYPASNAPGAAVPYARYLQVPDVAIHPQFRKRLETHVRSVVIDDLFHKKEGALSAGERAAFDKLLATATTTHLDAAPLPERFPVILYHPGAGGSFEENSVLFEYLASNGYVVVSSAFESPFPKNVANNMGGIERSGPDFAFMSLQSRQWAYADALQLAVMGHSAGAQNLLQWIGSPSCPARAAVSLDTTLEYPKSYELNTYLRAALAKLTPPRIPVLLFAQARLHPQFQVFDQYLIDAPRYEAEAAEVSHDGFVTHGFLGRALTGQPNADAVRRGYEEICRTIRAFLDASFGARPLEQFAASSPVTLRYRPAR
jgi:hypothetical protein